MKTEEPTTFEECFTQLEEYVRLLESGNLPLEEATEIYEQSVKLGAKCKEIIASAEMKIQTVNADYSELSTPVDNSEEPD